MGENSNIEWTDHTFNPWWGCTRVSPGCDHCYAEAFAERLMASANLWGGNRRTFGAKHWAGPVTWNKAAEKAGRRARVFLPWPEAPGTGRLSYLIREGQCITVLAWWDRTFDKRGAVNAAIQCDGWEDPDYLWDRFSRVYEPLAKQLTKPRLHPTVRGGL